MDDLVYPCKLGLNLSRKGVYKRGVVTHKGMRHLRENRQEVVCRRHLDWKE